MKDTAIFAATLGLSHHWRITSVSFAKDAQRMDINVEYAGDCALSCPICGREGSALCTESECWYHENFFRYHTYLHAQVPCLECTCGGSNRVERPWSRTGSKFTKVH